MYLLWFGYYHILCKPHRYTLGQRIDTLLVEIIEAVVVASFLPTSEKLPYIRLAIRGLDTLKVMLLILWETKSLDDTKYITLSVPLDEIGRMLGGWYGKTLKENSSATKTEEK